MKKEITKQKESTVFEGLISIRALISSRESGKSDRTIKGILFDENFEKKNPRAPAWLAAKAQELGFSLEKCPSETIDSSAVGSTHGGIIAFCTERTYPVLTPYLLPENGFFAMVEGIEDPYNFGYALRSLYAAGVDGIILTPRNWLSAAGVVCRASAGASEYLNVYISSPTEAADVFHGRRYKIAAADSDGDMTMYEADLSKPLFLIIGGERRGISRALLENCDTTVKIVYGRDTSFALSAASAAAVLGFEVLRQSMYPDK